MVMAPKNIPFYMISDSIVLMVIWELMSAAGYINVYDSLGVTYKHTIKVPSYIRAVSYFANMAPDRYLFFSTRKKEEKKLLSL